MGQKGKKSANRFKFKNFAERISEINVDVYHSFATNTHEVPENDKDTFFRENLEKWAELNCSLDFTAFYQEVRRYVQSFNQLVYHKDKVVAILKKYLADPTSLALEPCLDLLAQFSRDLLQDFYPYFEDFFNSLLPLLKEKNTTVIEHAFVCLAHVFKFTWRFITKDIENVFRIYKPLFTNEQKHHVHVFASESFAFLIRKTKHKQDVINFLFKQLEDDSRIGEGLGQLLFHSIKGVKEQFTYNAAEILKCVLDTVSTNSYEIETVSLMINVMINKKKNYQVLSNLWLCSLKHTSREYSSLIFDSAYEFIESNIENRNMMSLMPKVLDLCVKHRDGKLLTNHEKLIEVLEKAVVSKNALFVLDLLSSMILLAGSEIEVDKCKYLCEQIIVNRNIDLDEKLNFLRSLFEWNEFKYLKDSVLQLISDEVKNSTKKIQEYKKDRCFDFLVDLIFSNHLATFQQYHVNQPFVIHRTEKIFGSKAKFFDNLVTDIDKLLTESPLEIWRASVILENMSLTLSKKKTVTKKLLNLIQKFFEFEHESMSNEQLFAFSYCLKTYINLEENEDNRFSAVSYKDIINLLRSFPSNQSVLQSFHIYCTKNVYSTDNMAEIFDILKKNISSPYGAIRYLSCLILENFYTNLCEENQDQNLFSIITEAETTGVSLQSYRQRLLYLQKIRYTNDLDYKEAALRYLIANLFVNLSVVWEPVSNVISTYANEDYGLTFWIVWSEMVNEVSEICSSGKNMFHCQKSTSMSVTFTKYFNQMYDKELTERADYENFRILLWNAMTKFSDLAERKSRDLVPLFFKFFKTEYADQEEMMTRKSDLRTKNTNEDEDDDDDKDNQHEDKSSQEKNKTNRKMKIKTLCSQLKLFATFKNPRALSKEKDLYSFYLELLTHKDNEIQSLALKCLMTYKFKYLVPYKENFDKLMTDTTFRDELTLFSGESSVVANEHRDELMAILVRLLYGKLQRRSGLGISGKSSLTVRRNVVMQFLANCSEIEIKTFFDLILQPFVEGGELDVALDSSKFDLSSITPLRKQTGFLNMLSNIVTRLRKVIEPFEKQLFRVLLKIIWTCSMCLKVKKEVDISYHGRLKDSRHLGLMKLVEFFDAMNTHDYNETIDEIFEAAVFPQLEQLTTDSVQNITPLLRLFICWSKHSRYNQLLTKTDSNGISPISMVYQLLQHKSLSNTVEKEIMVLTSQLLTVADYEEDEENGSVIKVTDCVSTLSTTIGISILQPYVPTIISVISEKLLAKLETKNIKANTKIGQIIPAIQLSVLASISKFVTDTKQCSILVKTLFPLLRCIAGEETQIHVITTIRNLLPYVTNTEEYLHLIPHLFLSFYARQPRQILCQIYLQITKESSKLKPIAEVLDKMNSWDVKRLDEPDYDRRLEGYRDISKVLQSEELDCDQILPVVNHCLHMIISTDDMSLRDASSSCLEKIVDLVSKHEDNMFNEIVNKTIQPAIRSGLKTKKQATRLEFINILALIVRTFDSSSLNDIKVLQSTDPETDFFENIKHIQVHRRIRALQQLAKVCEEKQLTTQHMFTLFIPLISHVIFDRLSTTKDHNLLSETITTLGVIVKSLPWSKYLHILRNYLNLMQKDKQNQKTIIRVVVSILNNFHFKATNNGSGTTLNDTDVNKDGTKATDDGDGDDDEEEDDDDDDAGMVVDQSNIKISIETELRIHEVLTTKIFPQLKRFLNKRSRVDSFHKMAHNKEEDEEEIMKVPMTLAMVKLLQHLPTQTLHTHLPGKKGTSQDVDVKNQIVEGLLDSLNLPEPMHELSAPLSIARACNTLILRVSQALRSHARDVRDIARDTLKKICLSLGPGYFHVVLKEMRSVLLRGYQLHILGYTVHSLLEAMKDELKTGDMDACVESLMQVITEELFGEVSEEKNVAGITGKLMEAKSHKANDAIEIFTKYVSSGCISKLLTPLKEVVESSFNKKVSRKVEEALRRISVGLQHNKGLSMDDLLLFTHGLVTNNLQVMCDQAQKHKKNYKPKDSSVAVKDDVYLLPSAPIRGGKTPDVNKETNEHIFVEFGLQLLHTCLKRQRLSPANDNHVKMLDPFVQIVISGMTSKFNKVVVLSMRCLSFLIKFPVPSMKESVPLLAKQLFKILKKYAKAGAGKGENFELVMTSFKAMTVLIRDYKDMDVTNKQLRLLLAFVEEDIFNSSRQSTALPLLKAILSRKITVNEVHDVMKKIADLSIRDSDEVIRLQSRQLMLQYMLDYPLGKKINVHLDFYVTHLSYEEYIGRLSSLEFISSMIKQFPERLIRDYAGYFFLPLVMMLTNDESAQCRKQAASVVKLLIGSVDANGRNDLFDIVYTWSQQDKVLLKSVSLQVFGMFVEVEGKSFEKRLSSVVPTITQILLQEWEHEDDDDDDDDDEEENESRVNSDTKDVINVKDRLLYNTLTCLGKLCINHEILIANESFMENLKDIWGFVKDLLLHSHAWIRLSSSQLFGLYFTAFTPEQLMEMSTNSSQQYLAIETQTKVKELCSNFFSQLKDENVSVKIAEQVSTTLREIRVRTTDHKETSQFIHSVYQLVSICDVLQEKGTSQDVDVKNQATKNLVYLTKVVKLFDPYLNNENNNNKEDNDDDIQEDDEDDDGDRKKSELKIMSIKTLVMRTGQLASYEASRTPKQTIKRTCVFRWTAALCLNLHEDELKIYLANLLRPIHRELTTSQNTEGDLYKLAEEVLEVVRSTISKDIFAEVYAKLQKKVLEVKDSRKRKLAEEAVADPLKHALRKQKTNLAKRDQRKRKLYEKKPSLKFKKIRSKPET